MSRQLLLEDYRKAISRLDDALKAHPVSDVEKAGCIQYFEFSFELAWKTLKKYAEHAGINECTSPRAALKWAFASKIINNESFWIEMLDARNRMSHTYNATDALLIFSRLPDFVVELQQMCVELEQSW